MIEIAAPSPPSHQDVRPITRKGAKERRQFCRPNPVDPAGKQIRTLLKAQQGGKPTTRPAHRRDPLGIGDPLVNRPLDRIVKIALRSAAPFVCPSIEELNA